MQRYHVDILRNRLTQCHTFLEIVSVLAAFPRGNFCEIGLNNDKSVLTSLRSSLHTGNIFLFFEYIRKIHSLPSRLVTFKYLLSHCDRARSSRERGLQALPRLIWSFLRAFLIVLYLLLPLPVRRVVRGPAPRLSERRTFCIGFSSCGPALRQSERRTLFLGLSFLSFRLFDMLFSYTLAS